MPLHRPRPAPDHEPAEKATAQICLRFLVQQNVVVIPRIGKLERLSENAAIFDFSLDDAEIGKISALASRDGRFVDWAYPVRMQRD